MASIVFTTERLIACRWVGAEVEDLLAVLVITHDGLLVSEGRHHSINTPMGIDRESCLM